MISISPITLQNNQKIQNYNSNNIKTQIFDNSTKDTVNISFKGTNHSNPVFFHHPKLEKNAKAILEMKRKVELEAKNQYTVSSAYAKKQKEILESTDCQKDPVSKNGNRFRRKTDKNGDLTSLIVYRKKNGKVNITRIERKSSKEKRDVIWLNTNGHITKIAKGVKSTDNGVIKVDRLYKYENGQVREACKNSIYDSKLERINPGHGLIKKHDVFKWRNGSFSSYSPKHNAHFIYPKVPETYIFDGDIAVDYVSGYDSKDNKPPLFGTIKIGINSPKKGTKGSEAPPIGTTKVYRCF